MIALDEAARKAFDNARAFSVTMIDQGWGTVHVSSADCEIFLTRSEGKIDPLSPSPLAAAAVTAPVAAVFPAPTMLPAVDVTTPHIATVVSLVAVGTAVQAGQAVATLSVLDETIEIVAASAGTIETHGVAPGDLAEFGSKLVTLRP
ncbi:MAG: biotin/lipoyl-containing protein [Pseudomonadota bacterium]